MSSAVTGLGSSPPNSQDRNSRASSPPSGAAGVKRPLMSRTGKRHRTSRGYIIPRAILNFLERSPSEAGRVDKRLRSDMSGALPVLGARRTLLPWPGCSGWALVRIRSPGRGERRSRMGVRDEGAVEVRAGSMPITAIWEGAVRWDLEARGSLANRSPGRSERSRDRESPDATGRQAARAED